MDDEGLTRLCTALERLGNELQRFNDAQDAGSSEGVPALIARLTDPESKLLLDLPDGGCLQWGHDGAIRRFGADGTYQETREPGDENFGEWSMRMGGFL